MVWEFLHLSEGRGGQCGFGRVAFVCSPGWVGKDSCVWDSKPLGVSSPKEGLPTAWGWVSMHLGPGLGQEFAREAEFRG